MKVKIGDYVMHHMGCAPSGTLVRVLEETAPGRFGIGYVQLIGDSVSGGGSSWSWPDSEFRRITDPIYLLAARLDAANRDEQRATAVAATKRSEGDALRAAIRALQEVVEEAKSDPAVEPVVDGSTS